MNSMNSMNSINDILHHISISALPILLALTLSEYSYGFMANRLGDPTPRLMGRLSLDPSKHIDPIWTILMPLLCLITRTPILMGGAKPMPINYNNFKAGTIRHAMLKITLSGAGTCWILALIWVIISIFASKIFSGSLASFLTEMGTIGGGISLSFMALRLLPLPGTKASIALIGYLPFDLAKRYASFEQYSLFIFFFLMISGILDFLLKPFMMIGAIPINVIVSFLV